MYRPSATLPDAIHSMLTPIPHGRLPVNSGLTGPLALHRTIPLKASRSAGDRKTVSLPAADTADVSAIISQRYEDAVSHTSFLLLLFLWKLLNKQLNHPVPVPRAQSHNGEAKILTLPDLFPKLACLTTSQMNFRITGSTAMSTILTPLVSFL